MMVSRFLMTTSTVLLALVLTGSLLLPTCAAWWPSSTQQVLETSWVFYKRRFMPNGERVESNHYGGTITEGQSYALLKSVWMQDPTTFDRVWQWTQHHMKRPDDHLFGWRWGKQEDGRTGLIETETATDADQDIAYALLLAGEQWHRPDYTQAAKAIISDLWTTSVQEVRGKYYLSPGTWEGFHDPQALTINPSYMAPYVYRRFARADTQHAVGWLALAQNVYPTLNACTALITPKLPPNWCAVELKTGEITFSDAQGDGARDFGYDAFRVFWRMAMDAQLDNSGGSGAARRYLAEHSALHQYWQQHNTLPEGFAADGTPHPTSPSGFTLSALLSQQHVVAPQQDALMYRRLLKPDYNRQGYWFNDYNDYLHSVIWLHVYTLTLKPSSRRTAN